MRDQHIQWTLFLFFIALYSLTMSGRVSSPDGEVMFRTGQNFVERGKWDIKPLKAWPDFGTARGLDGRHYSIFGPGQSIALTPFIKLGRRLFSTCPQCFDFLSRRPFLEDYNTRNAFHDTLRLFSCLLNVWVSALACVVLYGIARTLGGTVQASAACSLLYGVATNAWAYSRSDFSEPLAILFVLISFDRLLRDVHKQPTRGGLVIAGACLGLSVLTHISMTLTVPLLLWYAWPAFHPDRKPVWRRLVAFSAPLLLCAIFLVCYNYWRFGNAFETGRMDRYGRYTSPWLGLIGLLFSPGKGIIWFSPLVVASVAAAPSFLRRWPREGLLIISMAIVRLLFIASRTDWHGGFCIGPRLLFPVLPFLILLLLEVIVQAEQRRLAPASRHALVLCGALALFVQIVLIKCNIFDWLFWNRVQLLHQGFADAVICNRLFLFSPRYSPLVGFTWFPPTDLLMLDVFRYGAPWVFRFLVVGCALLLAGSLVRLRSFFETFQA